MSEKLSEQMKAQTKRMGGHTFTEGTWWVSVADLEVKLEMWRRYSLAADRCGISDLCPRDREEEREAAYKALKTAGEWEA